jgi:beta-glucuronidase
VFPGGSRPLGGGLPTLTASVSRPATRLLLACLAGLAAAATAAAPAGAAPRSAQAPSDKLLYQDGHSGRFLLDGTWYFRLDPADQGLAQGLPRQTSLLGWSPVQVPHAWNATDLSDASQRGTVGWYRRDFRLPSGSRRLSWVLRFESVNYRTTVFLNGRQIGRNAGAYVPFEVPASTVKRGGVNRLVIRVDNRRTDTDLPPAREQDDGTPGGGWWNYGGLLREVYLRRFDRVDIQNLLARPLLPCRSCDATVLVRATLANPGGGRKKVRLRATVGGALVRFPEATIGSRGTRVVQGRVKIRDPRLWEPGNPELYRVRAVATINNRAVSSYATHIGIRSFKVNGRGRLLLNGRPLMMRGASIHEDNPEVGAALSSGQRDLTWSLLRELGATITRAHYPLHPQFLEAADRDGILVWDQIPFYRLLEETIKLKSVRDKGLSYLRDTILRDQNHASVLTWSIANELPSRPTFGQERYIAAASRLIRQMDPTRLSAIDIAGYPQVPPIGVFRQLDAIGVNSYFGWYPGPGGTVGERTGLAPYLDQVHDFYPGQAVFVTEFGAEANRSGAIDEKGTFEFQRDLMQFHISTYDTKPFVNGAIAWILRDFRVRPGWDGGNPKPSPPVNAKGLTDEFGVKKPAFDETRRLYRNSFALQAARAQRAAKR